MLPRIDPLTTMKEKNDDKLPNQEPEIKKGWQVQVGVFLILGEIRFSITLGD